MNRDKIKQIIFAEKQAEYNCAKGSKQYKGWRRDALVMRRQLGEYRPWFQLIRIYGLQGEV